MENKELLQRVGQLGYPLFVVEEKFDVNQTLAEVVKSNDARLVEGFVVLLANAVQDTSFNYETVLNLLTTVQEKQLLRELVFLSLGLYKVMGYYFNEVNLLHHKLSPEEARLLEEYRNRLVHGDNFKLLDYTLSPGRLKGVFNTYLLNAVKEVKKQTEKQEDFSLEYALSQVFSPKQKDLFLKRVKGENLTKTEKEYFSRTVKKKLFALTNPELSRFAKLLLS